MPSCHCFQSHSVSPALQWRIALYSRLVFMPYAFMPLRCSVPRFLCLVLSCLYGVVCLVFYALCFRSSGVSLALLLVASYALFVVLSSICGSMGCFILLSVVSYALFILLSCSGIMCSVLLSAYGVSPSSPLLNIVPDSQHSVMVFWFYTQLDQLSIQLWQRIFCVSRAAHSLSNTQLYRHIALIGT